MPEQQLKPVEVLEPGQPINDEEAFNAALKEVEDDLVAVTQKIKSLERSAGGSVMYADSVELTKRAVGRVQGQPTFDAACYMLRDLQTFQMRVKEKLKKARGAANDATKAMKAVEDFYVKDVAARFEKLKLEVGGFYESRVKEHEERQAAANAEALESAQDGEAVELHRLVNHFEEMKTRGVNFSREYTGVIVDKLEFVAGLAGGLIPMTMIEDKKGKVLSSITGNIAGAAKSLREGMAFPGVQVGWYPSVTVYRWEEQEESEL